MLGIQFIELLIFFEKFGLAVAGAASFWGFAFAVFSSRLVNKREAALWLGAAQKLILLFFSGIFLFGFIWLIVALQSCAFCAIGHEGISGAPEMGAAELAGAIQKQFSTALLLELSAFITLVLLLIKRGFILANIKWVYGFFLTVITIIYVYPWGEIDSFKSAAYTALHNWHSILTLGSVIVVDFIYIALRYNLRDILPKLFSAITLGIWIGLGLDFLSSGLVFQESFTPAPKTLFAQMLIGIIIINGVFLSGPLIRAIIFFREKINEDVVPIKLHRLAGISGAVSLGAWTSITAINGFHSITLSYFGLFAFYVAFVSLIYAARELIDKILIKTKVWR